MPTITEKRPRGGAPRRYCQALAAKVIALAETGCTYAEIARAAGISESSIYYWVRGDEAGVPDYQGFKRRFFLARGVGYARKFGVPPDPPVPMAPEPVTAKDSSR
jgi:transposase-like protein